MKKVYFKDNIFIWLHITGEDSNYLHVGFFRPEDRPIPIGIEDWKEASRGSGYSLGKIRKDDPNLLEVFTYEKYRKGWYKEWRVVIRHNIGGRFWHATIGVAGARVTPPFPISLDIIFPSFYKEGTRDGFIMMRTEM